MTRTYDANLELLTGIESKWSTTSQTKFAYTYNGARQRKTAQQSGLAFADYTQGLGYSSTYKVFTYNSRGDLETTARYKGDTVSATPSPFDELPGQRGEFRYDTIGNRASSGDTGSTGSGDDSYSTNGANQYTGKANNYVYLAGVAPTTTSVAVAGSTKTDRLDRAWGAKVAVANSGGPVQGTAKVFGASPSGGTAGADLVHTDTPGFFIGILAEAFVYDYAGNLTQDSAWDYVYDAENRLISMTTRSDAIGTLNIPIAHARRLEFKYDYADRRVEKIVHGGLTAGIYTTVISDRKYLYDGWNVIAEYDATSTLTLVRSYTWGLDVVGSTTAAGGVGALLEIHDHGMSGKSFLPTYDGNGNVVALINADPSTGGIAAVYDYGAFGEPLRAEKQAGYTTEPAVVENPFRFSTKFTDVETGLAYYGRRYYSPTLGRFINRDPIEEAGGINLYGFCGNDGINGFDQLGMTAFIISDGMYLREADFPATFSHSTSDQANLNAYMTPWGIGNGYRSGYAPFEEAQAALGKYQGPRSAAERKENYSVTADAWRSPLTGQTVGTSAKTWYSDGTISTVSWGPVVVASNNAGGGYWSQVGSYFGNYMLGVVESPWTLLKGVGRGYAEIGGLVGDATTSQFWHDLGTMATNPGATAVSTVQIGARVVAGTVASFADGRNLGNFVGGAALGSVALPGSLSTLSNASKGSIGEATSLVTNVARGNIPTGSQVAISVGGRTPVIDWQFQNVFTGSTILVESKFGTAGLTSAQRAAGSLITVEKWTYPFWSNVGAVGGAAGSAAGGGKGP